MNGRGRHCRYDQLVEYVSGDLAAGAFDVVRVHLSGCPGCRVRVERIQSTLRLVAGAGDVELNALYSSQFAGLVRRRIAAGTLVDRWSPLSRAVLIAAVVLVVLAYSGWFADERRTGDSPPMATLFAEGASSDLLPREGFDDAVRNYWLDTATTDELLTELDGIDREAFLVMTEERFR